jgi:hypothetical protein
MPHGIVCGEATPERGRVRPRACTRATAATMQPSGATPLVLPATLTYLIARAVDSTRVRRRAGVSTSRLDGLLRDTVRYLAGAGASLPEVHAAVRDVCEAASAALADPELQVALGEVEARACTFAVTATARPAP